MMTKNYPKAYRRPASFPRLVTWITLAVLLIGAVYGLLSMNPSHVDPATGLKETLNDFGELFFSPNFHRLSFLDACYEILVTIGLAFLTTVFGSIVALLLGLLGARNLSPRWLTATVRGFVSVIRAVPTILWVLIFAVTSGLGSTAAVIGLSFHSIGYLTKAYAEGIEELDQGVVEAIRSTGATWWQVVFQAVLPSTATYLLSWTFLRFEINFANAVAMGAAAGAAGIGFDLFTASTLSFDLHAVGLITYFILAFAVALEIFATRMKSNLKKK